MTCSFYQSSPNDSQNVAKSKDRRSKASHSKHLSQQIHGSYGKKFGISEAPDPGKQKHFLRVNRWQYRLSSRSNFGVG